MKFGCEVPSVNDVNLIRELHKRRFSLRRQHASHVNIEHALDTRLVASAYDYKEMELPVDSRATFAFSFSPDGTLIASTHGDHKIYVSQVDTGKVIYVLEGHPRTPWCVVWHPDSKRKLLASGCLGGVTIVWQLGDPVVKECWRPEREEALANKLVSSVAFHPTKRELLIAMANCLLFWDWNLKSPYKVVTTGNPAERISVVMFDPLSRCLFTAISNVYTPTLSEVLQSSFNPNESPSGNSSLRPITIDIINTGQLGPRCQSTATGSNRHTTSTQTEFIPQTDAASASATPQTASTSQGNSATPSAHRPSSRYNLRQTSARSASDGAIPNADEGPKGGEEKATSSRASGSGVKRKSALPVKSSARSASSSSRNNPKRRKVAQKTVGTNTDDLQNVPGVGTSASNETGPPSAIRANVYFSEFPATYYSSAINNRSPVFPLFNSDPHGAIFHSHFPRNFVRLETEPLHVESNHSNDQSQTSSSGGASSSTNSANAFADDTFTAQQASNNPEDYLRIAVVYCAANPSTSIMSTSQNHQATVPLTSADSGYRVSVRLHPPIDRNISIQSGAYGVRVNSERRSENDIDPPSRELSATDVFANRLIETLRSTLRSTQQRVNRRLLRSNFQEQLDMHDTTPNQQGSVVIPNPPDVNLDPPTPSPPRYPGASTQNSHNPVNESMFPENVAGSEETTSAAGTSQGFRTPVFVSSHHRIVLGRIVGVGPPGVPPTVSQGPAAERVPSGRSIGSTVAGAAYANESRLNHGVPPGPPPTSQDYRDIGIEVNPNAMNANNQNDTSSRNNPNASTGGPNRSDYVRSRVGRGFTHVHRRAPADNGPGVQSTRDVNGTHHLYDISVFDSRLRPNEAIQDAITRVVFGAFAATGDYRRAQQRTSFRLQYWDIDDTPIIYNSEMNVIEPRCKLLNQTAIDISKDGKLLGLLTSNDGYDFEETFVTLYALDKIVSRPNQLAQIPVGHNAISVSISPSKQYVFLGYFDKTSAQSFFPTFLMGPSLGEIFEFRPTGRRISQRLVPVKELNQMMKQTTPPEPRGVNTSEHPSNSNSGNVNCAAWLPTPGKGLVYGTTLGELVVCSPQRPKICRNGAFQNDENETQNDETDGTPSTAMFDSNSPSDILLRLGRHNFQLEEENMNTGSGELYL